MEIVTVILEILKYTLPALIVFLTAYYLLTSYMAKDATEKAIEFKMKRDKEIVMLRLQAYERLALFLERINFATVISRARTPDMLANELQYAIVKNIREEFEHNLSQQIYVSSDAWSLIVQSKEEMMKTVNLIGTQLPPDASAGMLINAIFSGIQNANAPLPTEHALEYLKNECRQLF
jgi:CRISPR/Cas system CMR subunit Cmr4 (Cas7 group RAMP superfamily)